MEPKMAQDNSLTRQLTLNISPEQYEKLFFQPTAAKGDLAKRWGMNFFSSIFIDTAFRDGADFDCRQSNIGRLAGFLDSIPNHHVLSARMARRRCWM